MTAWDLNCNVKAFMYEDIASVKGVWGGWPMLHRPGYTEIARYWGEIC